MAMSNELQQINRIDVTGRVGAVRGTGTLYHRNGEIILNDLELERLEALRQILFAQTGNDYYLGREPYEIVRDFLEHASDQYCLQHGEIELVVGETSIYDLPDDYSEDETDE
jgi:hypothetical protein